MATTNAPPLPHLQTARILIVDDHPMMREGLAARIEPQPDMHVCGEAYSLNSALEQIRETHPSLVIVDIKLADSNGINLVKVIHNDFPDIKMLVVSAYEESLYAKRALRAGAHGYVNKRELQESILEALRTVIANGRYLSREMTQHLIDVGIGESKTASGDPINAFSNRELEVFELIGRGNSTSEIARQLLLSTHTIDTYRSKLRQKLFVKNGTELMQRAVQWVMENG